MYYEESGRVLTNGIIISTGLLIDLIHIQLHIDELELDKEVHSCPQDANGDTPIIPSF